MTMDLTYADPVSRMAASILKRQERQALASQPRAKASGKLDLRDLTRLCDHYVPRRSRHPNSLGDVDAEGGAWWPAHEIGHLLVATKAEIGRPLFGLDDADHDGLTYRRRRYLRTMECAAMTISARLLIAVGRIDLAGDEYDGTDQYTITWWSTHLRDVTALLAARCPRVPRERGRLEALLRTRVRAVERTIAKASRSDSAAVAESGSP